MEIESSEKDLKRFSRAMAIALGGLSIVFFLKHNTLYPAVMIFAGVWWITGIISSRVLVPVYRAWMACAMVLSWINTRVILLIVFYLIFTPVGLVMRLLKKDLLDRKIDKKKESYWIKKECNAFDPVEYERMY
ncbi:MAG: SxtJ family membrane protein [Candidatus Omnitrophica bacterium]|nr:SxtJ family membrane protein [Candidatus Omnitrophota bacterium]